MSTEPTRTFPVEIFCLIGRELLPEEPFASSIEDFTHGWNSGLSLRSLAYTCRDVYRGLEPLLHRFVVLRNGRDIVRLFSLLVDKPEKRTKLKHISCDTSAAWEDNLRGVPALWDRRYGDKRLEEVLADAGFRLEPEEIAAISEPEHIAPDFGSEDALMFVFGSILLMAAELETLSMNREVTRYSYMEIARDLLVQSQTRHPILPKLRAMRLSTKYSFGDRGDGMETFLRCACIFSWRIQTLIVSGTGAAFVHAINNYTYHFNLSMPHVERLHIRPWDTPRELRYSPVTDTPVLRQLPVFFPALRVLDVEFVKTPNFDHDIWVVAGEMANLEILRLKNQRFPSELMEGNALPKLRVLSVQLCRATPDSPDIDAVALLNKGMHGHQFKHRALERLELNESCFRVEVPRAGFRLELSGKSD